jgi:hypothetical protein
MVQGCLARRLSTAELALPEYLLAYLADVGALGANVDFFDKSHCVNSSSIAVGHFVHQVFDVCKTMMAFVDKDSPNLIKANARVTFALAYQ